VDRFYFDLKTGFQSIKLGLFCRNFLTEIFKNSFTNFKKIKIKRKKKFYQKNAKNLFEKHNKNDKIKT